MIPIHCPASAIRLTRSSAFTGAAQPLSYAFVTFSSSTNAIFYSPRKITAGRMRQMRAAAASVAAVARGGGSEAQDQRLREEQGGDLSFGCTDGFQDSDFPTTLQHQRAEVRADAQRGDG